MKLLEFKSSYFQIACHPDKVDYFVMGNELSSGVCINGNFLKIKIDDLVDVLEEYKRLMSELEGV